MVYTLQYQNPGATAAMNVTIVDNLPATIAMKYLLGSATDGGIYNSSSNTLTWVFPVVPAGSNLQVTDQSIVQILGGQNSPVLNCAKLSFGSGTMTSCNAVSVIGSYVVQMSIYNSAGEIVKTYTTFETSSPISSLNLSASGLTNPGQILQISTNGESLGTWDGTNDNGQLVSNGSYFIKVTTTSPFGATTSVSQTVSVNLSSSTLTALVFNSAGEIVKHISEADIIAMMGVSGLTASDLNVSQIQISSSVLVPNYSGTGGNNSVLTITLGSGKSFTWNGTGDDGVILTPGTYYLQIQSTVQSSHSNQEITKVLHIEGSSEAINGVVLLPNPVRLNQTSMAQFVVDTDAAQVTSVDVKIYTLAGELVKPLLYNQPGNLGIVYWNVGQTNLASGTYIAVVELNTANGIIGHKILKVVVIR